MEPCEGLERDLQAQHQRWVAAAGACVVQSGGLWARERLLSRREALAPLELNERQGDGLIQERQATAQDSGSRLVGQKKRQTKCSGLRRPGLVLRIGKESSPMPSRSAQSPLVFGPCWHRMSTGAKHPHIER